MKVGLVLGAGGVLGGAWLTGGLHAVARETGWDPGSADRIVGTSAGSMIGALVAAGIPLLLAATAVAAAIGLIGPISQIVAVDEAIGSVILLIGLAVGVDYAMFYLRREMEERDAGRSPQAALEAAPPPPGAPSSSRDSR